MNQYVGSPSVAGALPDYNNASTLLTGTTLGSAGTASVAPIMTKVACVAAANLATGSFVDATGATAAWGAMTWDVTFAVWTSWWCSNGLYKQVSSAASTGTIFGNFNQ